MGIVGGLNLTALLLAVFITLKLANVVAWSWWWVILGPFAVTISITFVAFAAVVLLALILNQLARQ